MATGSFTISSGASLSRDVYKKTREKGLLIRVPTGFQGVLGFLASNEGDGTYEPLYDDEGNLMCIDLTDKTLPAWFVVPPFVWAASFLKAEAWTTTARADVQAQDEERVLDLMGQ